MSRRLMNGGLTTVAARRADPREHGRQAARSKRDRPGGHASEVGNFATCTPPEAACLIH